MNVLITGAASGIGKALKAEYVKHGYTVYAIDKQKMEAENNVISFIADVANIKQLKNIKEELNSIKFHIIVNVAGIHMMASLIENDIEKMKKLIDINLYGAMAINNVFYPLLDKKGRIIIITSEVAYLDPMPFNGLYSISKTALDCYAQALRQELNLLNQKVITIRPGAIETPLSNNSITDTKNLADTTILFQKQAKNFSGLMLKFMGKSLQPEKLSRRIYKISQKKHPKYIYKVHQNMGLVLLNLLPKKLQCYIIKKLLNR